MTGSGKTLAYLIPAFEFILRSSDIRDDIRANPQRIVSVIVLPTRELAQQVNTVALQYSASVRRQLPDLNIVPQLFIGGRETERDLKRYQTQGGNIIIGTPGRLYDLLLQAELRVAGVELLVLDEADRLLAMGFEAHVAFIVSRLPRQRRSGLFSATQTKQVELLAKAGLRNPVVIKVKVQAQAAQQSCAEMPAVPSSLENAHTVVPYSWKLDELFAFLATLNAGEKCIVFFLTCRICDFFGMAFDVLGAPCEHFVLHGHLTQGRRNATYKKFLQSGGPSVLLCTDVASRGLDIPQVEWVVQFDIPLQPTAFIHRIGRTGRMGKRGQSLLFLAPPEDEYPALMAHRNVDMAVRAPLVYQPPADLQDEAEEAPKVNDTDEPVVLSPLVRRLYDYALTDRELFEKGAAAFVSYVRAYKEHICNNILRLDRVDMGDVARAFALVRIPHLTDMAKYRKRQFKLRLPSELSQVDVSKVPYRREQAAERRQRKLAYIAEKKTQHEERQREEGDLRTAMRKKRAEAMQLNKKHAKQRRFRDIDAEEINKEAALLKRLRNHRVTEEQFSQLTGEGDLLKMVDTKSAKRRRKAT
eukprot:TRINITY_DN30313_c0_g1_i1.p1 TRINITY_DN30313_c0_g1~~TRINITY_DN30313_c0_g1_i1.p1  ORF type:complete len:646 (-),score=129.00 TRINITY_DN30313_c0_g1_i1:6-1760(-)